MPTVRRFATAVAPAGLLEEVRRLLDLAFDGDFDDDDWAHTLGGEHVVVDEGGVVVAHAAAVRRVLHVGDRAVATGYVEGVGTAPGRQGQGLGSLAMRELAGVIRRHHEMGALATGEHGFYERLGWERWRGPTWVRDGPALRRTEEDDDGLMVLRFGPSAGVDLTAPLSCEARAGDDW